MDLVVPAHLDGKPASGVQPALLRSTQMRGGSLGPTRSSNDPFYLGSRVAFHPLTLVFTPIN